MLSKETYLGSCNRVTKDHLKFDPEVKIQLVDAISKLSTHKHLFIYLVRKRQNLFLSPQSIAHKHTNVQKNASTHSHICTYQYTQSHKHMCTHLPALKHIRIYTHTHTQIHTCIHSLALSQKSIRPSIGLALDLCLYTKHSFLPSTISSFPWRQIRSQQTSTCSLPPVFMWSES